MFRRSGLCLAVDLIAASGSDLVARQETHGSGELVSGALGDKRYERRPSGIGKGLVVPARRSEGGRGDMAAQGLEPLALPQGDAAAGASKIGGSSFSGLDGSASSKPRR